MAEYRLTSKLFAEEGNMMAGQQQQQDGGGGMSMLTKGALGVGAAALAFAGARRGMLGKSLLTKSNLAYAKVGKMIGGDVGKSMMNNAADKYAAGKAMTRGAMLAEKAGKDASKNIIDANNAYLQRYQDKVKNNFLGIVNRE